MKDFSDFYFVPLYDKDVTLDNVWRDERIWEVNRPGIYFPNYQSGTNLVLICPGGAYRKLNPVNEGVPHVRWLNGIGVAAGILIYPLPNMSGTYAPLEAVKRAMEICKNRFRRIGIMGFSAGGHLAAMSECNFMITVSPVISMMDGLAHEGSRTNLLGKSNSKEMQLAFSANQRQIITNNAFLVHAQDDEKANVLHSMELYNSLITQNIPTSMHLLPTGGHPPKFEDYNYDLANWLKSINIV